VASETRKFSTDIDEDVIAEALKSVEKQRETAPGEASSPAAEGASEEIAALEARVQELEERERALSTQLDQERERTLRALADLDNARKRAQRDREDVVRFGLERVLKDLLPVVDNLDRALDLGERTRKWDGLAEGVRMTRKLLEDTLAKHGLKSFSARGKPFDPNLHEAMGHEEREDLPPNTVGTEVLRGFTLHDRLVRPALVMVARLPTPAAQASTAPAATEPATSTSTAEPAVAETAPPSSETEPSEENA
jgi:molecular chaperone GrpE